MSRQRLSKCYLTGPSETLNKTAISESNAMSHFDPTMWGKMRRRSEEASEQPVAVLWLSAYFSQIGHS